MIRSFCKTARNQVARVAHLGLAFAVVALTLISCPNLARADYTPATLGTPVEVIATDSATSTVISFIGPIMAKVMLMMIGFAAIALVWGWMRRFASRGRA